MRKIIDFIEKYESSNEGIIDLYTQEYPSAFVNKLNILLQNFNVVIINTPKLIEGYKFKRERPIAFFQSIDKSNTFNSAIGSGVKVLNFSEFTERETYDGVHYTELGNSIIFSKLKQYII